MHTAGADGRTGDKDTQAPIENGLAGLGLEHQWWSVEIISDAIPTAA